MKRTDLLDAGAANRVDDATIATRRQVLKRIALGAMVTVGSPWVMAQAIGTGFLRGNCRRDNFPTQVDTGAGCVDKPPGLDLGSGMFTYTPAGEDPMTALQILLGLVLGQVPVVGPLLVAMLNLMWPAHADPKTPLPDIWSLVKQQVADLIGQEILTYYQGELTNLVTGFNTNFDYYRLAIYDVVNASHPTKDQIKALKDRALYIQQHFESSMAMFTGIPKNGGASIDGWKVLPLYVQAANLHITFLYDLISNAADYGIEPGWVEANLFDVAWRNAIAPTPTNYDSSVNYLSYVPATLAKAMQAFKDEYDKATKGDSAWNIVQAPDPSVLGNYFGDRSVAGRHGAVVAAFYGAYKLWNEKINRYTVTVSNILEAWKHLPDPFSSSVRPVNPFIINQVLWCGPYGLPDMHDLAADCTYDYVSGCSGLYCYGYYYVHTPIAIKQGGVDLPNPAKSLLPNPADVHTPDGPLTHIHIDERGYTPLQNNSGGIPDFYWRFPSQYELKWNKDPPNTSGRFNLAIDADHPVIKVNIHTCNYTTPPALGSYQPNQSYYWAAGTLIGGLEFVQENVAPYAPPPAPQRGVDWPDTPQIAGRYKQIIENCCDGTVFAMQSNNDVETASIDGYILCNIAPTTGNSWMWSNLGEEDPSSTGTIMFAFRPKNPNMYPSVNILSNTYVTSPKTMTVDDIVDLGTRWYASRGVKLSAVQLAQLKNAVLQSISSDNLQAKRDAFWSRG